LSENRPETDLINKESLSTMKYSNYAFMIGMIAVLFAGLAAIAITTTPQFSAAQMMRNQTGGNTTMAGNATSGMNSTQQNSTTMAK
jgi:hypothetical protein